MLYELIFDFQLEVGSFGVIQYDGNCFVGIYIDVINLVKLAGYVKCLLHVSSRGRAPDSIINKGTTSKVVGKLSWSFCNWVLSFGMQFEAQFSFVMFDFCQ